MSAGQHGTQPTFPSSEGSDQERDHGLLDLGPGFARKKGPLGHPGPKDPFFGRVPDRTRNPGDAIPQRTLLREDLKGTAIRSLPEVSPSGDASIECLPMASAKGKHRSVCLGKRRYPGDRSADNLPKPFGVAGASSRNPASAEERTARRFCCNRQNPKARGYKS
jgi:hypothetical protein